jgi:hypothetical protein
VVVSYETIRRWCDKFGASFAHRAKAASREHAPEEASSATSESQRHLPVLRPRAPNVTRPAERMETQQRGAGRIGGADRKEVEMTSEQQARSAKRRLTVAADRASYSSLIEKRPARSGPKDCLEQSP